MQPNSREPSLVHLLLISKPSDFRKQEQAIGAARNTRKTNQAAKKTEMAAVKIPRGEHQSKTLGSLGRFLHREDGRKH
jgi:hypothetical protein